MRYNSSKPRFILVPIPINFNAVEIGAVLVTIKEKNMRQG